MLKFLNGENRAGKSAISPNHPPDVKPEEMERLIVEALNGAVGLHRDVIWRLVMVPCCRWAGAGNVKTFHEALQSLVARGVLRSDNAFFARVPEAARGQEGA
jgi:hypothetical protein